MEKLFIPKTIKVGFNYREDTYTNKLAYVIYYDAKGKLRKETSWSNWIQRPGEPRGRWNQESGKVIPDDFEPKDLENKPMSGFVINKGVGGARNSWGWNARNEYIRVFDPRGFEFEISTANLLYILGECTSTKGKGLEGEFVYSWDGKELVLLPVDTYEYKQSNSFTTLQDQKITKKDMVPGRVYKFKDTKVATYIGRFLYIDTSSYNRKKTQKRHIFIDDENNYIIQTGFTKLAEIVNETPADNLAELIEDYESSKHFNKPTGIITKPLKANDLTISKEHYYGQFITYEDKSKYDNKSPDIYLNNKYYINLKYHEQYNLEKSTIDLKTADDITKKLNNIYEITFKYSYSSSIKSIHFNDKFTIVSDVESNITDILQKLGIEFSEIKKEETAYYGRGKIITICYMTEEQYNNNIKNGKFNMACVVTDNGKILSSVNSYND